MPGPIQDTDLNALAAANATHVIYYRHAPGDWRPVVIGPGLYFTGAVLSTLQKGAQIGTATGAVSSASSLNLAAVDGPIIDVTGATDIDDITLAEGEERLLRFVDGGLTINPGATLLTPGGLPRPAEAGSFGIVRGGAAGVVSLISYQTPTDYKVETFDNIFMNDVGNIGFPSSVIAGSPSFSIGKTDISTGRGAYLQFWQKLTSLLPASVSLQRKDGHGGVDLIVGLLTDQRAVNFPDKDGTFAYLDDVPKDMGVLDSFVLNADNSVLAVVIQSDGKILLGGNFTNILGYSRNYIARVNSDGSMDKDFDPSADGPVNAIAVQADGSVLVGGGFSNIGGQTRSYIARLDSVTGLADSFDPAADDLVWSLAVQADGSVIAGGDFAAIGGQTRNHIARLDATTGLADSFDPNLDARVYAILIQPDTKILIGGRFTGVGADTRKRIARLDAATGVADSFDPAANGGDVLTIALQADGSVLAAGQFTAIGGQSRNYIARLDASTGLADSFDPNSTGHVFSIAVQPDGKILAGGGFCGGNTIGEQSRNYVARLDPNTGLADSFDPNADAVVRAIAIPADGKVIIAGDFSTLTPSQGPTYTRPYIARLLP